MSRNFTFYIPESIALSNEHVQPGADLFLPSNFSSFYTKDLSSSNFRPLKRCDSWRILVPDISPLAYMYEEILPLILEKHVDLMDPEFPSCKVV
jgi:hypothetical protein